MTADLRPFSEWLTDHARVAAQVEELVGVDALRGPAPSPRS